MAEVVIRLKRLGTKKRPHHRIVVITKTRSRDSKAIEEVGYYDASKNPPFVKIEKERVAFWVGQGAILSPTVKRLFKKYAG